MTPKASAYDNCFMYLLPGSAGMSARSAREPSVDRQTDIPQRTFSQGGSLTTCVLSYHISEEYGLGSNQHLNS